MLKKFERISQGKELSVGHHKVRQETSSTKAKTLNIPRNQQIAEEIDYENGKISKAIMTAKISVAAHNDKEEMGKQIKYRNLVSKTTRLNLKNKFDARRAFLLKNLDVLPQIDSGIYHH